MAGLVGLLGEKLHNHQGEVSTADALSGKKAIALYFSAHWCPPCRGFTPKLAEWYKKDLQAKGLEVIFVSSDKDEDAFKEYFAEQPWLSLPYANRDAKAALSKKFKVQGIPSLVILDPAGNTITLDGRGAVSNDPTGLDFPWAPVPLSKTLEDAKLVDGQGNTVSLASLRDKKAIALYFSAHWCPPCRGFTPKLAEWYKKDLQAKGLEVIFVSSDRDEAAFKEYFAEQPWLALAFEEKATKSKLDAALKVEGIPTLVILDPKDFSVITSEGRGAVTADPAGNELPWHPKPVNDLSNGPGDINEVTTLLVFCEESSAEEKTAIEQALTPIAEKYIAAAKAGGDLEFAFLTCKSPGDELGERLRGMLEIPASAKTQLTIVDIPDNGGYYLGPENQPITAASVEAFLAAYKDKTLTRKQLS